MTSLAILRQSNGYVTKSFYADLNACGFEGELACALFRAQKRSEAAKSYRGGKYRRAAYDVKNWSLSEICRILQSGASTCSMAWGWQRDPATPGYEWVLYVDLPTGQVSFHSAERLTGPEYQATWDRQKISRERILAFCDYVLFGASCAYLAGPDERRNEETAATAPNLFGATA